MSRRTRQSFPYRDTGGRGEGCVFAPRGVPIRARCVIRRMGGCWCWRCPRLDGFFRERADAHGAGRLDADAYADVEGTTDHLARQDEPKLPSRSGLRRSSAGGLICAPSITLLSTRAAAVLALCERRVSSAVAPRSMRTPISAQTCGFC
jgi:hypothetical protein